jgi:hypothetical protein
MLKRSFVLLVCLPAATVILLLPSSPRSRAYTSRPTAKPQAAHLVINEYLADPPDGPSGDANGDGLRDANQDEFVEIVNASPAPLSIAGFTIRDSAQIRFTFPPGSLIPPGEAAIVFGGGSPKGAFGNAAANSLVFAAGGAGLSLNNGGDSIIIRDNNNAEVARRDYPAADGNANQSVTRSPDVSGGFVAHTAAASSEGALFSPGTLTSGRPFVSADPIIISISPASVVTSNSPVSVSVSGRNFKSGARARLDGEPLSTAFVSESELTADIPASALLSAGAHALAVENPDGLISNSASFTVIGALGINEFLADPPDAIAGDANADGMRDSSHDEFIEIVNRTAAPVLIGGFTISDADHLRFTFPPNLVLPAGEAAIVFGGGSPRGEFGNAALNGLLFTAALSLNNGGDTIVLKDAAGNMVESISYGSSEGGANQSINRSPDIVGAVFAPHSAVASSGGKLFSPGLRADGLPFTTGPRISAITPDRAPFGALSLSISISGSGFDIGSAVFIDSSPAPTSFTSDGELTATVPARITTVAGDHAVEVRNENGNRSNVVTLTIIPPGPFLRLIQPPLIEVRTVPVQVSLLGANFDSQSAALIDGAVLASLFVNARELSVTLPAALVDKPGVHSVRVRNGDGRTSNELLLEVVLPRPRITLLHPPQALAGGADFGLAVAGANFKSGATVMFGETPLTTKLVSPAELEAAVPAALIKEAGLRSITVVNPDGAVSNETVFRIIAIAPRIDFIEPSGVAEGAGDLTITLAGENFRPGATARVMEGLAPGLALVTRFLDERRLEARLPGEFTEAAGRVLLRVENPDFGVSNTVALNVLIKDSLVINEFLADPPETVAGDANADGARSPSQDEFIEIVNRTAAPLDLSGFKLSDAEAVRHVFPPRTVLPPFEAAVVFGGGSPGGQFGNAAENGLVFKASSGELSLNNGGDTIKLEDADGHIIEEIKFGATEGSQNQALNRSPDIDGATFLPHALVDLAGSRLFSPGTKASGETFTVKPRVTAITPASVRKGAHAFTLILSGARFIEGAMVIFDGTPLVTAHRSVNEIEAQVSSHLVVEGGAVEVRVRNPKGEFSEAVKFLVTDDPPRVASMTPQRTGTGAADFEITVAGERFQRAAVITVAGEPVETRRVGPSVLAATVPQRFFTRAAELEVRVLNADGNRSNGVKLKVENGPLITRAARSRLKAGRAAVELAVGGLAFRPGVILFVNDKAISTDFTSETAIVGRVPEEMTASAGVLTLQARNPDGGRSNKVTIRVVE